MARPKLNRVQVAFYLSTEDLAKMDLLADGLPRAEWLRATIHQLFAKRFPIYSTKAQARVESTPTLAPAGTVAKNPKQVITAQELIDLAGETSDYADSWRLHVRNSSGDICGAFPIDRTQKGLNEVLPKLREYGLLSYDIDYIFKDCAVEPTPQERRWQALARTKSNRGAPDPEMAKMLAEEMAK